MTLQKIKANTRVRPKVHKRAQKIEPKKGRAVRALSAGPKNRPSNDDPQGGKA
jgi:hypothetical protein